MLSWRKDSFGSDDCALFLGSLFVGQIMQLYHRNEKWCAWFVSVDEGNEIGRFDTAFEARLAVESALLKVLPKEIALIVEANTAS
jgi:hypothetical protein